MIYIILFLTENHNPLPDVNKHSIIFKVLKYLNKPNRPSLNMFRVTLNSHTARVECFIFCHFDDGVRMVLGLGPRWKEW